MNRCTGGCHQSDAPCDCQPDDELTLAEEVTLVVIWACCFVLFLAFLGWISGALRYA